MAFFANWQMGEFVGGRFSEALFQGGLASWALPLYLPGSLTDVAH